MTKTFPDFERLFALVKAGGVILTPNERLARFIHRQYAQHCALSGVKAWPSLPCYSINAWFRSQWESLLFVDRVAAPMLVDATQENAIWLSIIRNADQEVSLFNDSATAGACRRAWNTLVQWQVDYRDVADISEVFKAWAEAYERICEVSGLIDASTTVNRVNAALSSARLSLPKQLIFYAFDDINPQVQDLMDIAEQGKSAVTFFNPQLRGDRLCRRFAANDPNDEIRRAARWAASKIAENPDATVGIVVPKLLAMRAQVERIFTEVFEPQYQQLDLPRHASAFNISAGIPLSEVPPVAAALTALKLNARELEIEDVTRLMHSPFLGKTAEIPSRAQFAVKMRERYLALAVTKLRTLVGEFRPKEVDGEESKASFIEDFYQRLHAFQQLNLTLPAQQSPSAWGKTISAQLEVLGWPGERVLDTLEYQQVEAWTESITQLTRYDYIFPQVSCVQALEFITRITFEKQFQAQTSTSPVQVLGLFEAAGLVFDNLWVMNLDDESWPPPINPNPLLPKNLQKIKSMPMASVDRELALAEKLTHRFMRSARAVVLSFAQRDGDKECQHSALINNIPSVMQDALAQFDGETPTNCVRKHAVLEIFHDARGPALANTESIRGGTQIIKDQAACPFRAYASHRLGALRQESAVPGLGPAERGMLIHDTLEYVWNTLGDQATLIATSDEQLDALIIKGVEKSFRSKNQLKEFGDRLRRLERGRILGLLRAWLELEKQRPPFSVFFSEVNRNLMLGNLPIHIRYDRIDRLDDGSLFVIDYKTGKTSINSWAGDRPDEPQVPIYGIANSSAVTALAFGQINIDEISYKGICERDDIAPGLILAEDVKQDLPQSWRPILQHWREVLENLATEFVEGVAEVAPKHGARTCQYCALQSLCRIKETLPQPDDPEREKVDGSKMS